MKEKFGAASAGIGAALGVGVGASIAASLDVSAANSKLAAQLGVGPAEAAKLAKVSASVYKNAWGESTADVNDAIKSVYQNIGDTSTAQGGLEGVTTKVLALRDTFNVDLGETTSAVGQMMKTGMAKNATEAMDIITAGLQKGADKSGDFLATLNEYGTQFRKVGIDGQMATGLISQGLKAGARDGDLVADSIKEFSIRAVDGSKTTAQGFQSIGLNAGDMASKIGQGGKSANDALALTLDHLRGIEDPVKRNAAAVQLFGTQAEDMGAALFALDPSTAVDALGKVGGAADRMAKTVGDNPKAALEGFKRTAIMATTDIAGKFVSFAMKNQSVFKPLAAVLAGVAAAIVLVQLGTIVWTAATTAWTVAQSIATAAQWAWNSALLANPMTWIIIGIIALIAVIVLIATKTTWFQTAWKAMTSAVAVAWNWIWGLLKQGFALLTTLFMNFTGPGLIIKHWDTIKRATSTAWNAVWGFIKGVPGRIVNLFLNWTLPGLIIKHWSTIKSRTISVATATVNWVKGLPGRIGNALVSLGNTIIGIASRAWNGFRTSVVSRATSAVAWVRGLPGRVKNALGNLGGMLYNSGKALLNGFIRGIKAMASGPADAVKGALSKARDLLPFSPAKVGPFSGRGYTTYSGQALMLGLAQGITSKADVAKQAMTGAVSGAAASGQGALSGPASPTVSSPMTRGGQAPVVLEFRSGGSKLGDLFVKVLREEIRVRGGDVQKTLGGK